MQRLGREVVLEIHVTGKLTAETSPTPEGKPAVLYPKLFLGMALNTLKLLDIAEIDRVLKFLGPFVTVCAFPIGQAAKIDRVNVGT